MMRCPSFVRDSGFTLVELIIVLGLSSMLTVSLFTIHQAQRSQQLINMAAERLEVLKGASLQAMVDKGTAPQSLSELLLYTEYPEAEFSPWGERAELEGLQSNSVTLSMLYPTSTSAERIATLVAGAWNEQARVFLQVHLPVSSLLRDSLLHRKEDVENPERNQMETNLNMNGFSVFGANKVETEYLLADSIGAAEIISENAEFDYFFGKQVESDTLSVSHIDSGIFVAQQANIGNIEAESLSANVADLDEVHTDYLSSGLVEVTDLTVSASLNVEGTFTSSELNSATLTADFISIQNQLSATEIEVSGGLTATSMTTDNLQTNILRSENVVSDTLYSEYAEFEELAATRIEVLDTLFARQLQIDNLQAGDIHATDFVTSSTSLNQLEVELANYQQLWQQCVDAGGCQ